MPTSTAQRVPRHTARSINKRIDRGIEINIAYYAAHPEEIDDRLRELDQEWDIERAIEANAATISGLGLLASVFDRRWLILPMAVSGFLLQHAIQGWCPPVPALRRLGFRTADEINEERYALRRARGDFR